MEYGLWRLNLMHGINTLEVLILVVMEYGLWQNLINAVSYQYLAVS